MVGEPTTGYVEFATEHSAKLFRTACLLTGDWHLAEDLVQETLAKMYRMWHRAGEADSLGAYANTVLTRTFLSHRRLRRHGELPSAWLQESAISDGDAALRLALLDGLAGLPAKDRAVLVLRYWEDRTVEETAQVLKISEGAVRSRALRALTRLRLALDGQKADLLAR